jgi:hypothetical protein
MTIPTMFVRTVARVPVSSIRKEMKKKKRSDRLIKRPSAGEGGGKHKKLALYESLLTTRATYAGLTRIQAQCDHIWDEVNQESYKI